MPAAVDRLQFAPPPPPGMLRALGLALIAHLLLLLALGWGVNWKRDPVTLSAEAELWSSLPQEAAPKLVEPTPPPPVPVPGPAPVPVPVPPPPPVVAEAPRPEPAPREADIAIEREKEKKAEEKRKQLALEREKKREAEKEKQLEARRELDERRKQDLAKAKAAEDKRKQELTRKQLAEARQKVEATKRENAEKAIEAQRQANLDRIKGLAGATGSPTDKGTALRASGPSSSYAGRVAARVKPNIVFTEDIAGNPRAEIEVRTAPDGTIVGQRILKSSGVKAWDDAVLKAVIKTQVLPRDTDGRVPSPLIIDFRPRD